MSPVLLVIIPALMVIAGMVYNSIGLSFEQPPSSPEQDPAKRLAAERASYRQLFDRQRSRALKRQKRIGQFGWLLLIVFIASSIWLYSDTVNKTAIASRVAALQTLGTEQGQQMVLSLTQRDGNNVKYLVKLPQGENITVAATRPVAKETISSWELENLATALSVGETALPLGVALKISN